MLLQTQNQQLAKQHFDTLPDGDINRQYFEGRKFVPTKGWLKELIATPLIRQRIETLNKFYPYQRVIKATKEEYEHDSKQGIRNALTFTAVSWFTIFGFARYGKVAPIFREYGLYFKTHRVFRHYLYALILPLAFARYHLASKYFPHVEALWEVHVNRLNNKILDDPSNTVYPYEMSTINPCFTSANIG